MLKDMKQITSPLRQERELRGWSRGYVAEKLEVDIATVGRWEREERVPHPCHQQKLCELFSKNAQELGWLPKASEELDDLTITPDPSLQKSSTNGKHEHPPFPFFRRRWMLLVGLGGIGIIVLARSIWIAIKYSSQY